MRAESVEGLERPWRGAPAIEEEGGERRDGKRERGGTGRTKETGDPESLETTGGVAGEHVLDLQEKKGQMRRSSFPKAVSRRLARRTCSCDPRHLNPLFCKIPV